MFEKLKKLDLKWKIGSLALILILIWQIARTVSYRAECYRLKEDAVAAYERKDFVNASALINQFYNANFEHRTIFFQSCPNYKKEDYDLMEDYRDAAWQITELEGAIKDQNSGNYLQAIIVYERLLHNYPDGIRADEVKSKLAETYQLLFQDTGVAGKNLMMNIYTTNCGVYEFNIPDMFSSIVVSKEPKYWYPEADPAQSNYIARVPAEFRVAVCYDLIQTTDIIESCYYGSSNSVGAFQTAINRMNASYKIKLVDTVTSETIAELDNIQSSGAGACPESITYNSAGMPQPIIGLPDLSLIPAAWFEEQLKLLK